MTYQTIIIDKEIALINAVKSWFHLKQNLLNQAKICGLFNKKIQK